MRPTTVRNYLLADTDQTSCNRPGQRVNGGNGQLSEGRHLRTAVFIAITMLVLWGALGLLTKSQLASAAAGVTGVQAGTENVAIPSGLNEDEIRDYLAKLPDERIRELLIADLSRKQANKTARASDGDMFQRLEMHLHNLRKRLSMVFTSAGQVRQLPALLWTKINAGGTIGLGQVFGGFITSVSSCLGSRTTVSARDRSNRSATTAHDEHC